MATNIDMVGTALGLGTTVTDPRWTPTDVVNSIATADYAAMQDIRTLDAYLAGLNAGYWTALRLAQATINDKIYWLRVTQYGQAGLA